MLRYVRCKGSSVVYSGVVHQVVGGVSMHTMCLVCLPIHTWPVGGNAIKDYRDSLHCLSLCTGPDPQNAVYLHILHCGTQGKSHSFHEIH